MAKISPSMAAGTLDRKPLAIGLGEKPARSLGLAGLSARWLRSGGPGSSRSRRRPVRKFDPDRRARLLPTLTRGARAIDAGRLLPDCPELFSYRRRGRP